MRKTWTDQAWEDYLLWQTRDKKTLKRINELVKSIERDGEGLGLGKPEALRGELSGWWSRRIDGFHRLVYKCTDGDTICIASCMGHYGDR